MQAWLFADWKSLFGHPCDSTQWQPPSLDCIALPLSLFRGLQVELQRVTFKCNPKIDIDV